jgi:hypothetical protein
MHVPQKFDVMVNLEKFFIFLVELVQSRKKKRKFIPEKICYTAMLHI